ncbi:integrase domain-containing protein [Atopomonas sediminilitoris]|uniref:integrase domain-containing protein n=1 Tax=Atopomonas sediminilitoris TaxID=2919919 RepID=UPI001F4D7A00|nr:integrase domain-containing protein [Atopomonas sediminilitoris]MCJ8170782.1 integrase domain-containing protein [Atopomonas sediminilitoris]
MAKYGKHNAKNFGHGRSPKHAAKNALRAHCGNGRFATVEAHSQRFNLFCDWMRINLGIDDLRKISHENLVSYADHLKAQMQEEEISVATAHNRISSCNVVFKILRGDNKIRIDKIGVLLDKKRTFIRTSPPNGTNTNSVALLQEHLVAKDLERVAAIVGLARACGMRLREAILSNLPRLRNEASKRGEINIQDGTKGGRKGAFAERWIPATDAVKAAIDYAIEVSPKSSKNLLSPEESYISFLRGPIEKARRSGFINIIKGFHELRAAYACQRYEELVGHPSPVISKRKILSEQEKESDREGRQVISKELGHNRTEITNSYLGSSTK